MSEPTIRETYEYLDKQFKANSIIGNDEDAKYLKVAKMIVGSFEQIQWERDVAIEQLKDLGYSLGEKPHDKELEV